MGTSSTVINVMLVDSNVLFRAGIARLLEMQPDMRVLSECDRCEDVLPITSNLQPDVMLLDTATEGCDGALLIKSLKQKFPATAIVVLTTEVDSTELLGAVLAGASGYLQKSITPDELFARLRGLQRGEAAMALTTVTTLVDRLNTSNCALCLRAAADPELTPRECDILKLVARGLTNKVIGKELQISEHTVRNHLCSIYDKLNLKNRLQVAVYSVTHGLVDVTNGMVQTD